MNETKVEDMAAESVQVQCLRSKSISAKYGCQECEYVATSKDRVNAHSRRVHEKEKNYFCHACDFSSFAKSSLRKHVVIHDRVKYNFCGHCDFKTLNKFDLETTACC